FGRNGGDDRPMRRICNLVVLAVVATICGTFAAESQTTEPPAVIRATDSRVAGDAKRTRLIVDLSAPLEFHAFALADPYRVVVDLPQIAFAMPSDIGKQGRGLVSVYRF